MHSSKWFFFCFVLERFARVRVLHFSGSSAASSSHRPALFSAFLSCIPPAPLSYAGHQQNQHARSASYLFTATRTLWVPCFDFCTSCSALSKLPSGPNAEPLVRPTSHAHMLPCAQRFTDARYSHLLPALLYSIDLLKSNLIG